MYQFITTQKPTFNPLDTTVVPKLDTDSIIQDLKLDTWEARKIPNYREDAKEVGESFMIRRFNKNPEENAEFHDIVLKPYIGAKYKTLQYDKGVRWLDPFLMEGLLTVNSVFYVEPGSKLCVTSDIGVEAEVLPGDTVRRYFILVLSHDGSTRMLGYCDTCPVCENTLEMAKAEAMNRADKHFTLDDENPEKSLEHARATIDLVRQRFYEESMPRYGAYAELALEPEQIDNIFRTVINAPLGKEPSKFTEKLHDKYEALYKALKDSPGQALRGDANGWGVLGAVSNFTKFMGDTELKQYTNEMFGSGRRMRKQTMELLDNLLPDSYIPVAAGS